MGTYRAFQGANGWYVAWESEDGFHHAPSQWDSESQMSEARARSHARRMNADPSSLTEEAMMTQITLVLGRDGMGADATESDFEAWVAYVCDRMDSRVGFGVDIQERGPRDIQSDAIESGSEAQQSAVAEAKAALWHDWCAAGAPR